MTTEHGLREVTLLLGGTSEIGLAITKVLRCPGGSVVLAGRDMAKLGTVAGMLDDDGPVRCEHFDAAEITDHRRFFDEVLRPGERLGTVIIAFGVLGDQAAMTTDPELAVELMQVNYNGAVSAMLHAANLLERHGGGRLVVLSSVAGQRARAENFLYGSTKAGIDRVADGLRSTRPGLEIVTVRPGFVHTAMTSGLRPAPFATTSDKVAEAVRRGLEQRRSIIWAPGILRWVFLALRPLPERLWQRVGGPRR
jgi:decaprenylphospho-beta-D-erythro-pentofuranosid-2-ulose 2-reductase